MRTVFLAFVTSILVFFTGLSSASAKDYLYCIQGDDFAGAGECIYATHAQCQAAASGRTASCTENRLSANAQLIDRSQSSFELKVGRRKPH
jgi:hypothetical protein